MSQPLVAIVTPVYNGEEFLAEAMESVQAQTYPNVVHVILDNASTDRTAEIIRSFEGRKVPLIVGRNNTLLSMDENWNTSLKLLPKDAVYFRMLCADDTVAPEATQLMVALAESDPAITAVCSAVRHNDVEHDFMWPTDRKIFDGRYAIEKFFKAEGWLEARHTLMRASALSSADPFFDLNVGHSTDIDSVLRLLTLGKFGFLQERLAMSREHDGSATTGEMMPLGAHLNDWLILLHRYGRYAFGDAEYAKIEKRYRRFYFARLLRWRFIRNQRAIALHKDLLAKIKATPSLWDYADAALFTVLKRLGLAQGWYSYPN